MTRQEFEKRMPEVEREVGRLLRRAAVGAEKTAGMAREILQWEKSPPSSSNSAAC
ncbi:hypothetical protein [Stigmatella ashevillensis]|uniref:hypothetical protein n=1 Tax=Stigmatella ashevillensis TaxID=2995309 RepID=UPI00358DAD7F